jgi:flagellar basal-body rod modification protein FlgD
MVTQGVESSSMYRTDTTSNTRAAENELGKDAFLMLLVTQLKYQDPLDPLENTDMVAQLAQFSALEQSEKFNQNIEIFRTDALSTNAVSLLGAEVTASKSDETGEGVIEKTGIVTEVKFIEGQPVYMIDGTEFNMKHLTKINIPGYGEEVE